MKLKLPYLKSKLKHCWLKVKVLSYDYASHSTIHGVNYIAEENRSGFEKVWWILVFIILVICCGQLILNAWHINPIIISFTGKPTPIWQIPFPTITICPRQFARSDRIDLTRLTSQLKNGEIAFNDLGEKEKIQALAKNMFCPTSDFISDLKNYTNCNGCLEAIREIRIPMDEIFIKCRFGNRVINCTESFKETLVGFQFCYVFNEVGVYRQLGRVAGVHETWTIDDGYKETAAASVFPRRAMGAGLKFGFSILLRSDKTQFDFLCSTTPGFLLEHRMPFEAPLFATNHLHILTKESLNLVVSPDIMTTSDELRRYAPAKRKCYFSNEQRLTYFKHYTQSNCENECQIELVLKHCRCLPINIEKQPDVDVCGPYKFGCLLYVKDIVAAHNLLNCNCLPVCSSISFTSEVSMQRLNESWLARTVKDFRDDHEYSEVNVFFKENHFISKQRAELYGRVDFLANCGGLLSLCLGFSVISFLEILYFCTIRPWFDLRSQRKEITQTAELKPKRSFLLVTKHLLDEYVTKTTIQGINYLAETSVTLFERMWWAIFVIISVYCCGTLIADVYRQYDGSPVIISYANEETAVSHIPFPAVTVCPQYVYPGIAFMHNYFKVKNSSLYDLNSYFQNISLAVAQVCDSDTFNDIDPANKTDCEHCADYLKMLMGTVDQAFIRCQHIYINSVCRDMFREVATEGGVCFVYNSYDVYRNFDGTNDDDIIDAWTLEGGYRNYTSYIDVHPRAGSKSPLWISMYVDPRNIDGLCKGAIQAFKVYLHLPNEAPQIAKHFYMLPYYQYARIFITPKVTVTVPELRDLSVAKRQCYFSEERYLRFFRHYTQNNCEIECLVNLTLSRCGCLMFHMPKIPGVKLCGISDVHCSQLGIRKNAKENIQEIQAKRCHCLPTCTSISYDTAINYIQLPKQFTFSSMEISFQENQFVALKRSQLFGKTEFLANCGGLLGLFLGFSVLSILELIYFCTIRLVCNLKMELSGKKMKKYASK